MYIDDYRKLDVETRRKIYESYYKILNDLDINSNLRNSITGILFENINNVFTLKIYNPQEIVDKRLLYIPVESTLLGKNKKTSVPYKIDTVRPIKFDVIDENIYTSLLIDENIESSYVIDENIN